jgi:hypothetical protein
VAVNLKHPFLELLSGNIAIFVGEFGILDFPEKPVARASEWVSIRRTSRYASIMTGCLPCLRLSVSTCCRTRAVTLRTSTCDVRHMDFPLKSKDLDRPDGRVGGLQPAFCAGTWRPFEATAEIIFTTGFAARQV